MTSFDSTPLNLTDIYQTFLQTTPLGTHQYLSPSSTPESLPAPPPKNSIRFIENDQNRHREKYDGRQWRALCIWKINKCTNIGYNSHKLCRKHYLITFNNVIPQRKRKPLTTHTSLPATLQEFPQNNLPQPTPTTTVSAAHSNDDDDIQIIGEFCSTPIERQSLTTNVKPEHSDFYVFSVDHVDEVDSRNTVKSEPTVSIPPSNNKQKNIRQRHRIS